MPSQNGHYDQNLLASAPAATKSQLQEGYNPDLLAENRPARTAPLADPESARASKEHLHHDIIKPRPVPFWRTMKGLIIIFVVVLVIIGAVVGGAVGGTKGKKKNGNASIESAGSGQGASAGSAPASSSSGLSGNPLTALTGLGASSSSGDTAGIGVGQGATSTSTPTTTAPGQAVSAVQPTGLLQGLQALGAPVHIAGRIQAIAADR